MGVAGWLRRLDEDALAGAAMTRRPIRGFVYGLSGAVVGMVAATGAVFLPGAGLLIFYVYTGFALLGLTAGVTLGARRRK